MKHGYAFVTSIVVALLLTLLVGECSHGQYYYSPCQNGQCPPQQYQQPRYVQPQQPVYQEPQQQVRLGEATDVRVRVKAGGGYQSGSGTAFGHYQSGTLILTNHHVIEGGSSVVVCIGQRELIAKVLGSEPDPTDAAILWVPGEHDVVSVASDTPADAMAEFRAYDGGQHFRCWQGRILGFKYDSYLADTYSVGGNSGGGVYVNGTLVGVVWGNRDGRLAFTGVGPIRKLCARLGIGIAAGFPDKVAPQPSQPPTQQQPACPNCPEGGCCPCNLGDINATIDARIEAKLKLVKLPERGEPGPAGPAGPPGKDATIDEEALAQRITAAVLANIKIPEPVNPPSAAKHYVLVADAEADYWPRMAPELKRAQEGYSKIKLAPPPSYSVGALPQMVEYLSGVPQRTIAGTHNVSTALAKLSQGETP